VTNISALSTSFIFSIANKSNNSHAKAIKCLLLQAWRERWSDIQWGINLKKHLLLSHNHVNGDTYGLSGEKNMPMVQNIGAEY
jgi:hypothetical protein